MSTNLKTLRANLYLSATVAIIGISAPIALSYVLQGLLNIDALQAFAAGAALCSTSLGTTLTVLSTSGLTESRLGVVLTSAAMMDDVVGLIMVQVITSLGQTTSIDAATVLRPIGVSLAFAILLPLACIYLLKPIAGIYSPKIHQSESNLAELLQKRQVTLTVHTLFLVAMVTVSSYAGTSNLFAAYLAGACVNWWESQTFDTTAPSSLTVDKEVPGPISATATKTPVTNQQESSSLGQPAIYDQYFAPAVHAVFKPFFFASIGFSIPVTELFVGAIVWRGFIYAALMVLGKIICGICLVRFDLPRFVVSTKLTGMPAIWKRAVACWRPDEPEPKPKPRPKSGRKSTTETKVPRKPRSLYPAAILGSAMVARGEIGFLISAVAESKGVFGKDNGKSGGASELFLIVTWAILLCTVLGPVTVGLLVRRLKHLQAGKGRRGTAQPDPLGVWGLVEAHG